MKNEARITSKHIKVEDYPLFLNGHYVRKASRVWFRGREFRFIERMTKHEAVANINYRLERHPEEFKGLGTV